MSTNGIEMTPMARAQWDALMVAVVPKYYQMNPDEETILFDGRSVENGMVVLVEDSDKRQAVAPDMTEGMIDRALTNNQWCRVEQVTQVASQLEFVGLYVDGRRRKRRMPIGVSWLVKKSSQTTPQPNEEALYVDIERAVRNIMLAQDSYTYAGESEKGTARAPEWAAKIVEIIRDHVQM